MKTKMTRDFLLQLADRFRATTHSEKAMEIIVGLITLKFVVDNATCFQISYDSLNFGEVCRHNDLRLIEDTINLKTHPFTSALSLLEMECTKENQFEILNLISELDLHDENHTGWVADIVADFLIGRNIAGGTAAISTAPSIANLLAAVGSIGMPQSVSDPFLGIGLSIKALKQKLPEISVYGCDIAPLPLYYASLLQILIFNREFQFQSGNSLQTPISNKFDLILSTPPLGLSINPKEVNPSCVCYPELLSRRGDWTFVQTALASLNSSGKAVLQLSMGPLFQTGKIANIRKSLLQAGHIKAIIQLPNGCWQSSNVPTCIVVVTPKSNRNHVFMINAAASNFSKYFDQRLRRQTTISDEGIEYIRGIVASEATIEGQCRQVSYEELASTQFILTPEVYLKCRDSATIEWTPVDYLLTRQAEVYQNLMETRTCLHDKIAKLKSV